MGSVFINAEDTREWFTTNRDYVFKEMQEKVCCNCGSTTNLHIHHIVPLSKGGRNKLSNLITVCGDCHSAIHGNKILSKAFGKKHKVGNKYLADILTLEKLYDLRIVGKRTLDELAEEYNCSNMTILYYEKITGFKDKYGTVRNSKTDKIAEEILEHFKNMESGEEIKGRDIQSLLNIKRKPLQAIKRKKTFIERYKKLGVYYENTRFKKI